jgi:hypothetical protein
MAARIAIPRAQDARAALPEPRPGWTAIIAKAFALAALERPALRRMHASLPWPRLLELPWAAGCVLVEREHHGEAMLTLARFPSPHRSTLTDLSRELARAKHAGPEEAKLLRRQLRFARLPWPLRRLAFAIGMATARPLHRYSGSFGLSALGAQGTVIIDSVSVLPVFLSYGPIAGDGTLDLHIAFDHRVMDGADAAAALRGIEAAVEGPIAAELIGLREPL